MRAKCSKCASGTRDAYISASVVTFIAFMHAVLQYGLVRILICMPNPTTFTDSF